MPIRLHFARDRLLRRRTAHRILLCWYVDRTAMELQFHSGPADQPRLADGDFQRFSVLHPEGVTLYLMALNRETGADLE